MPEEKVQYLPRTEILSFEEMERIVSVLASMGIKKIRLTGGEPFVRTDLMKFIRRLVEIPGVSDFHLTTNGVLTAPHIPELKKLGIGSVNLSLDTLNRNRFTELTRRDALPAVLETLELLLRNEIPVKVNAVVMDGKNTQDLLAIAELARQKPVDVRFIEEMPFNGREGRASGIAWDYRAILAHLENNLGTLIPEKPEPFSTSSTYRIAGFTGTVGVIAAWSRTFCGSCNRIRVTAKGDLKTCLYDEGVLNIKSLLRNGITDEALKGVLTQAFTARPRDGFEAEKSKRDTIYESMSSIGG